MAKIHCSIHNCHYWKHNNICDASEIMIMHDSQADRLPDRIDAPKAQTAEQFQASSCMETCCKTFAQAGTGKVNVDGVFRA
ncbi:MAG: DUF1540 domain-containing protein [Firmicutes bacterium]|nr:DUF1540 domain-containing protein [Bacillota bacterium]